MLGTENVPNLVADQIVKRLNIQLGCESLLYAVDDGEFLRAVFGDFEQALSLIEETRVLEGHAHAIGKCLQQAHVRVAEGVLVLHIDQVDQPTRLIA